MVPAPFIVVVDANALFPLTLRDTLLRAAAAGFYQLRWSEVILDEMERNLVSTDTMSAEKAVRLRQHMERFFPEALVTNFELKSWCVQGRVDIVVATRLDRLNRKMSHWVQLAAWFKQTGIELVFVDGGTGARGPLADLVNNIVASFAEFERELIRERLLDAHARMRERGLRSAGRVPLGYKADIATRQLVIDEDEAASVRAFFERCAAGASAASIARWANDAGHRTTVHGRQGGNRWSSRTVLQILRARLGSRPLHAPWAPSMRRLRQRDDDERVGEGDHRQRRRGPALLPVSWRRRASCVHAVRTGLSAEGGGHRACSAEEG